MVQDVWRFCLLCEEFLYIVYLLTEICQFDDYSIY